MRKYFYLLLVLFIFQTSIHAQRDTIKSVDEIPRFTYKIDSLASVVYTDKSQFRQLYLEVEKNYLSLNDKYVILDATFKKSLLSTLQSIDIFEKRYDEGRAKTEMIKSLQEKLAQKATSGILSVTYLNTIANQHPNLKNSKLIINPNWKN